MVVQGFRLATRLRKHRLARGLTQVQVAQVLGLKDSSTVSRWERGVNCPSASRVMDLATIYQCLPNDLLSPQYLKNRRRIYQRLRELNLH